MEIRHFLTKENKVNRSIIQCLRKSHVHHAGTIAQGTGYKTKTIERHLSALESSGYIFREDGFIYLTEYFDRFYNAKLGVSFSGNGGNNEL